MPPKPQNKVTFTDENISLLFGFEDAESEPIHRLREYYLKNETYSRVSADLPLRILVGHKGVGKSALFKMSIAEEKEKGNLPILIKPDDIAELGKSDENFLLKIRQWKYGLTKIIGAKVFSEFGLDDDETLTNKLSKFGIKLISFISDSITEVKDKIDLEPTRKLLVENFLKSKKIIIYLDDLDRGWEGKKDDIIRISTLLNSVRDMANENPGLSFKVSLRSDVYFLVRTSDESTDKIEGSVVWYSWSNNEILSMLIKRVLTYFDEKFDVSSLRNASQHNLSLYLDDIMVRRFEGKGKWENKPTYKILMSMIRKRPRDMVKLCTLAARDAYKEKSNIITTQNFINIFEEYSQGRMQDTINEYRSELPNIEKLLLGMKPSRKSKRDGSGYVFSAEELQQKINNIMQQVRFTFSNGKLATAKDLSHFLYKINFLTARKEMADGEIHRKYYDENKYLISASVNFGYDFEIHPAYRWVLKPDSLSDIFHDLSLTADDAM